MIIPQQAGACEAKRGFTLMLILTTLTNQIGKHMGLF